MVGLVAGAFFALVALMLVSYYVYARWFRGIDRAVELLQKELSREPNRHGSVQVRIPRIAPLTNGMAVDIASQNGYVHSGGGLESLVLLKVRTINFEPPQRAMES